MSDRLNLGIAGLGTVGVGVLKIIRAQAALLQARTGKEIAVSAISARNRTKNRDIDISSYEWEDDPVALARRKDVDIFIELMGGSDGPAKAATETALARGIPVVTANKAMMALHGQALAELAEHNNTTIRFEAAVAGGIPCVKALSEGLAGNRITRVLGVMNGTCNYILTRMEQAGLTYDEAFAEADGLGYVEADPTLDVGGIDAAHKLALLSVLAFGARVDFDGVAVQGIEAITIEDIRRAADMGYRIKLLGLAQIGPDGLQQSMKPCLVPAASALGQLEGGTNMVVIEGDAVDRIVLSGPGAGEGPTASAVLGDVCDLARGVNMPVFGQPAKTLDAPARAQAGGQTPWYLRMALYDRPGALAAVASVMGEAGVSINRMRQYGHEAQTAPLLFVTHACAPVAINHALDKLDATDVIAQTPVALQIHNI